MIILKRCYKCLEAKSLQCFPKGSNQCLICRRKRIGKSVQPSEVSLLKQRVRSQVNTAIKYGSLIRPTHCNCGKPKPEAHHEDYNKPFDIIWFCRTSPRFIMKFPKYLRGCHVSLWHDPNTVVLPFCWMVLIGGRWHTLRYADSTEYTNYSRVSKLGDLIGSGFHEDSLTKAVRWKKVKQFQVA